MRVYIRRSLAERFWPKVDKSGECWLWTAATITNAIGLRYGHISLGGRGAGSKGAHRVAYEFAFGPIPAGLEVCHWCDNTLCVRSDHLFLGTHAANMRDEAEKDRAGRAKLSNAQVIKIRMRYAQGGVRQKDLAKEFGVRTNTISEIVRRVRRVHI